MPSLSSGDGCSQGHTSGISKIKLNLAKNHGSDPDWKVMDCSKYPKSINSNNPNSLVIPLPPSPQQIINNHPTPNVNDTAFVYDNTFYSPLNVTSKAHCTHIDFVCTVKYRTILYRKALLAHYTIFVKHISFFKQFSLHSCPYLMSFSHSSIINYSFIRIFTNQNCMFKV
jgi:hypothetical protein